MSEDCKGGSDPDDATAGVDTEQEHAEADADIEPDVADVEVETNADDGNDAIRQGAVPGFRLALLVGLLSVLVFGALGGWLGYGVYRAHQADLQRSRFLAVGKQGALNLTTIDYNRADADVQRILESSTGQFYDDFSKRAPAFIGVVKETKSKTQGSITEAGMESIGGDSARVLVAVAVNTSNATAADQPTRHWRMRVDVQKVGDAVKVSNVGFVP
jgi:Mce-associated membrane protein